jgi:RNA-directed DNA polymerase
VSEPETGHEHGEEAQGNGKRARSEATPVTGQMAVLAEHSTEGLGSNPGLGRWGTETQGTHGREGEAGHPVRLEGKRGDTSRSPTIATKLQRIAEQAIQYLTRVFTTLLYLIDVDFLREAYQRTRKDCAPGVEGVTAEEYAEHLEENLRDLPERIQSGRYMAPPVKRTWLDKEDGSQRPIGLPTFEDKIVQRAVAWLLGAIYEQDFYECSYGLREGCDQHQALHALREQCLALNIRWIVDADVRGFFDTIDHRRLMELIRRRINDGGIVRLIGQWLKAGVLEGDILTHPEHGTPQGGVISPLLATIFLHYVLDEWYEHEVKPRMNGRCFLIRFADDFLIGFEREEDARRVMDVLPKRFNRFGLTIHPTKTALILFGKPDFHQETDRGNGTFDFLGFTHYWTKSRQGYWVIKRKTASKRLRRTKKSLWQGCRDPRHTPLSVQYRRLCQKLRGHCKSHGIRGNYRMLESVLQHTEKAGRYWLSRRSHKSAIPWEQFSKLKKSFPLPIPRIVHNI